MDGTGKDECVVGIGWHEHRIEQLDGHRFVDMILLCNGYC